MICGWCSKDLPQPEMTGRPRLYCDTRCRVAHFRERKRYADVGLDDETKLEIPPVPRRVAALYIRERSVYHSLGVDPWPASRDALTFEGPGPVIAHPPCAPWGRFRTIAPTRQRADLAVRAVDQVRWYGGVLEHPASSRLWLARDLPEPGEKPDQWGGWSLLVRQSWWGHRAPKATWLYIVGRPVLDFPEMPAPVPDPGGRIEKMGRAERERTPPDFARWLIELAGPCVPREMPAGYRSVASPALSSGNDSRQLSMVKGVV